MVVKRRQVYIVNEEETEFLVPKTVIRYDNEDKITTRLHRGDKAKLQSLAEEKRSTVAEQAREIISQYLAGRNEKQWIA